MLPKPGSAAMNDGSNEEEDVKVDASSETKAVEIVSGYRRVRAAMSSSIRMSTLFRQRY